MERLNMQSKNILGENMEFIASRFPNVITETKDEEGNLTKKIDFELLMQELSGEIVEGNKERYQLTWPGKKEAILMANTPIKKTLRPVIKDSVDFENTENIYIEGDNLEVLKLLQESYLGKIKCIYIDPPYNTGRDFVYKDDFKQDTDEYLDESGQTDEYGNRFFQNTDSNGRFHSDWITMIYPRLKLARNLLTEDGVIFISLDDNEISNLKKVCDEIFGEQNFVEKLIWKRRATPPNDRVIGKNHEYILVYSKNINMTKLYLQPRSEELNSRYKNPDNDPRGRWVASDLSANGKGGRLTESCVYSIVNPKTGEAFNPPQNKCWLYNEAKMKQLLTEGRIGFRENSGMPFLKRYLSEVRDGSTLATIIDNGGFSQDSAKEIKSIFDKDVFEFPKPTSLIKILLTAGSKNDDIVLDFFSGSCSTAHAVIKLNAEDGGNRKFIMIQVPEETKEKSEAYKEGYETICEIGKERIRRAGKKIKEETNADIDYGFRVYKVDSTNMKDTYYNVEEISQTNLFETESNIKDNRNPEDLLAQVILDLGLELSLKIEEKNINGKKVFYVDEDSLVACFDDGVDKELAMEIAKDMPMKVIFRDSCFSNDSIKENIKEIFKKYSNDTDIKVL